MRTPWGVADREYALAPGVVQVTTPSHGGIRVERGVAERRLSEAARSVPFTAPTAEAYWYEEDCDVLIVLWEIPETRAAFYAYSAIANKPDFQAEHIREYLPYHCPRYAARVELPPSYSRLAGV